MWRKPQNIDCLWMLLGAMSVLTGSMNAGCTARQEGRARVNSRVFGDTTSGASPLTSAQIRNLQADATLPPDVKQALLNGKSTPVPRPHFRK